MSLFEDASLVITPNGTKAGKLYAVKPTDGSGDLTVTRATSATRVNASGVIETVAANVPRLDYSNGTCPSILVEPQRTNLILNSATVATQSISVTAQSYILSFYGSGTVALSGTHTASVVGLGTARKTYTFTPTAGTLTLTITGTCTKAQLEAGSYATSYIPTTSASVTRNADLISKTGISSLIGQTEGTVFLDLKVNSNNESILFDLTPNTLSPQNRIIIYQPGNNTFELYIFSSNTLQTQITSGTYSINTRLKFGIGYKQNDVVFYINGVQIGIDNSCNMPIGLSRLDIFNRLDGNFQANGLLNLAILFKTRLTNTELVTLTTI